MTPKDVLIAALIRAFILAVVTTLGAIGSQLAQTADTRLIVAAGLTAFSAAFVARMMEGGVDMLRASNGTVLPSDVGHTTTSVTTPDTHTATVTVAPANP